MIIHLSSLSGKNKILILEKHCKLQDHESSTKHLQTLKLTSTLKTTNKKKGIVNTHKHPHINTRFETLKDNSLTYNVSFQHLIFCKDEYFNNTDTEPTTKKHVKIKEKAHLTTFFN